MADLKPITALGGETASTDNIGPFTLQEVPDVALASVAVRRGKESGFATGIKKIMSGGEMPGVAQCAGNGDYFAFWTGPGQWMVEAPHETHELLASLLKDQLGYNASVTEQSDAWCRFDLLGQGATRVLERLCAVDVQAMEELAASRTSIEHMGAFVICRKKSEAFSIYGPRSSAASMHHAILAAMKSAA